MQQYSKPKFYHLHYNNLEDMLKIMLSLSQSPLGVSSLLYHINYNSKNVMFIYNSSIGSRVIHYTILPEKPITKFIKLNKLTGKYEYVDSIIDDSQSILVPILELEHSSVDFPI